jgi:hypothetical protein
MRAYFAGNEIDIAVSKGELVWVDQVTVRLIAKEIAG